MSSQEASSVAARDAASLTLIGVVVVSVIAALFAPVLPTGPASTTKLTQPAPVRIVDTRKTKVEDVARATEGCAEQTWPYIEARCLTRATNIAAPLANTAPLTSATPVAPLTSPPHDVQSAPQAAVVPSAPVPSQTLRSDLQPTTRDVTNRSVVKPADTTADVTGSSSLVSPLPAPPGAKPRLPEEIPASAPSSKDTARGAPIADTVAAGLAMTRLSAVEKVRPRAERRRRAVHSSRNSGLFGFRIGGIRF